MNDAAFATMLDKLIRIDIPLVVEDMASWELGRPKRQMFLETVYEVLPSGAVASETSFVCDEKDFASHIGKAKRMGLFITFTKSDATVIRPLKDGRHYKVVYVPIPDGKKDF